MKKLSLRERQFLLREEAILETAHTLLASHGFATMTMDDVAAGVGISKATLYQHFASKEELAVRVVLRALERVERHIQEQDPSLPAIQRLEAAVRAIIQSRFGGRRPDLHVARPVLFPLLRDHPEFKRLHDRLIATCEGLVEQAKAEGSISPELNTTLVVIVLLGSARDADYEWLLAMGKTTVEELEESVVTLLFDGVRNAGARSRAGYTSETGRQKKNRTLTDSREQEDQ